LLARLLGSAFRRRALGPGAAVLLAGRHGPGPHDLRATVGDLDRGCQGRA